MAVFDYVRNARKAGINQRTSVWGRWHKEGLCLLSFIRPGREQLTGIFYTFRDPSITTILLTIPLGQLIFGLIVLGDRSTSKKVVFSLWLMAAILDLKVTSNRTNEAGNGFLTIKLVGNDLSHMNTKTSKKVVFSLWLMAEHDIGFMGTFKRVNYGYKRVPGPNLSCDTQISTPNHKMSSVLHMSYLNK